MSLEPVTGRRSNQVRALMCGALCAVLVGVAGVRVVAAQTAIQLRSPVPGPLVDHFDVPDGEFGPGRRGVRWQPGPGRVVRAVAPGAVVFSGPVAGAIWVTIDHGGGYRSSVGPLQAATVATGSTLGRGDPIGISGEIVHLGLRRDGRYVDPEPFLIADHPRLVAPSASG